MRTAIVQIGVEIRNTSGKPIRLNGVYLTDSKKDPMKWGLS